MASHGVLRQDDATHPISKWLKTIAISITIRGSRFWKLFDFTAIMRKTFQRSHSWRGLLSFCLARPTIRTLFSGVLTRLAAPNAPGICSTSVPIRPLFGCGIPKLKSGNNVGTIRVPLCSFTCFRVPSCACKSLKFQIKALCHGRGREFESRRPRHSFRACQK